MEIIEARDPEVFDRLRPEWDALLARCERATIYQSWEWNEAWWHAYGRGKRLRLLEVRDGNELVGIAPLYVSRHLGTPLRRLAFVGTGAADYMDVVASDARGPEVAHTLLDRLRRGRGFDMADLQQLRETALVRQAALPVLPVGAHQRIRLVSQEPCPYVALPETWQEYAVRIGKKMRSNVAYAERLLDRTFTDVRMSIAEPGDVSRGMDALFDLHQKRWHARLLPGVLGGERVRTFHRRVAEAFASRGWLRLHLLEIGDRIAAVLYCFRYGDRYYYYLGGFDPELSKYSLGTVLTAHAVRQAIAEGCAGFDFLRGNEDYKYRWHPEDRVNQRLLLLRPRSVRSHAMLHLNRLERYVEHRAKEFAARHGRRRAR